MPQPIAYNTGSQTSGSLKLNGIEYAISSSIVSGSNGQRWFSSVNPGNGIVLVTNSFTQSYSTYQNSTPLFYTASALTAAAITGAINSLPDRFGLPQFTDTASAFAWVANNRKYFMMNYEYPEIVTDRLILNLDAKFLASYPTTQSTWYDISGFNNSGSLTNGPTWDSDGYFVFDGTDDYAVNSSTSLNITGNVTMNAWVRNNGSGSAVGNYMSKAQNNGYRMRRNGGSGSPFWLYSFGNNVFGGAINDNIWYMVTGVFSSTGLRAYINGNLVASNSTPYSPSSLTLDSLYIGAYTVGAELFGGNIQGAQVYSLALTEAQIKQNYYGGPIVTDGLVFAVDASNLVSYESGSTTTYSLTGSLSGSLINGTGYSNTNGGTWNFDGVDDYIDTGKTATQLGFYDANYTMEAWVYPTDLSSDRTLFGTDQADVRQGLHLVFRNGVIYQGHYGSDFQAGTVTVNNWYQIVYTFNASNGACQIFKNSISQGTGTISSFIGTTNILIARWAGTYYFQGPGGIYRIYNRVLTPAEVQQNFQAQRSRFGL